MEASVENGLIETDRKCYCGQNMFSDPRHSVGDIHAICLQCPLYGDNFCMDCFEGAV